MVQNCRLIAAQYAGGIGLQINGGQNSADGIGLQMNAGRIVQMAQDYRLVRAE